MQHSVVGFITKLVGVYCCVRTGYSNRMDCVVSLKGFLLSSRVLSWRVCIDAENRNDKSTGDPVWV